MNQHKFRLAVAGMLGAGALLAGAGSAQAATEYQLTIGNAPDLPNGEQHAPFLGVDSVGGPVGTARFPGLKNTQPIVGQDYLKLGTPNDTNSRKNLGVALDAGDFGRTVGYYQQTNLAGPDPFGLVRPLYYNASANTRELPVLPGLSAELRAVNAGGIAVGYSFVGNGSTKTPTTGFVFRNTAPTPTTTPLASLPGGTTSKALAISGTGLVAGQSDQGDANRQFATLWRTATPTNLGGLPGSTGDAALSVNNNGDAVGFSTLGRAGDRAVLFAGGKATDLGFAGQATAINNGGTIVGTSGDSRAVRYQGGKAVDLNTLIPAGSGFTLKAANDINDAGQIVGEGSTADKPDSTVGFILEPIN
jgi:probable HAF family extracellular repeat protein